MSDSAPALPGLLKIVNLNFLDFFVLVLLSSHVERFSVSCKQNFICDIFALLRLFQPLIHIFSF